MAQMIRYPKPLRKGETLAVTAPSSGVEEFLHQRLHRARRHVEARGYRVIEGETLWTNDKCVSAPKEVRARELQGFLLDDEVQAIMPPWGGEFAMDILPLIDWEVLKAADPKWVLGWSDISTVLFPYTMLTGTATAYGPNYIDCDIEEWDALSRVWPDVLGLEAGGSIEQVSSELYQSSWKRMFREPALGYDLDTPTCYQILGHEESPEHAVELSGRLLGGCLDTLTMLCGTKYAPVEEFVHANCREDGVLWYLEAADIGSADIYRHLWHLKQVGWFDQAKGVLFGRLSNTEPRKNFELRDALLEIFGPLDIPVVYETDIGHKPPQWTFVNGAAAHVKVAEGRGRMMMSLR